MSRLIRVGLGIAVLAVIPSAALRAEDTLKKWQIGGGISYWSTDDNIRSNAGTAYAPVDPSQGGLPSIYSSDPRPDANELREPTIQDGLRLDFNASFGVTRWFALAIETSYFQGEVGDIEFYSEDHARPATLTQVFVDPTNPNDFTKCDPGQGGITCYQMSVGSNDVVNIRNGFVPVGSLTQVPLSLSGVVRFRPESPFDPYIGGGVGYIFTSLDTADSNIGTPIAMSTSDVTGSNRLIQMKNFRDVQDYTNGLIATNIQTGARALKTFPCLQTSIYPPICETSTRPVVDGGTPLAALTASVDDAPEFHLMGGADYYISSHFSLYIDGRYVWARSKVEIRIDNESQIFATIPDYGCVNGADRCRSVGAPPGGLDTSQALLVNDTVDNTNDQILIQGGDIRLGGFSLGVGVRFTF